MDGVRGNKGMRRGASWTKRQAREKVEGGKEAISETVGGGWR